MSPRFILVALLAVSLAGCSSSQSAEPAAWPSLMTWAVSTPETNQTWGLPFYDERVGRDGNSVTALVLPGFTVNGLETEETWIPAGLQYLAWQVGGSVFFSDWDFASFFQFLPMTAFPLAGLELGVHPYAFGEIRGDVEITAHHAVVSLPLEANGIQDEIVLRYWRGDTVWPERIDARWSGEWVETWRLAEVGEGEAEFQLMAAPMEETFVATTQPVPESSRFWIPLDHAIQEASSRNTDVRDYLARHEAPVVRWADATLREDGRAVGGLINVQWRFELESEGEAIWVHVNLYRQANDPLDPPNYVVTVLDAESREPWFSNALAAPTILSWDDALDRCRALAYQPAVGMAYRIGYDRGEASFGGAKEGGLEATYLCDSDMSARIPTELDARTGFMLRLPDLEAYLDWRNGA